MNQGNEDRRNDESPGNRGRDRGSKAMVATARPQGVGAAAFVRPVYRDRALVSSGQTIRVRLIGEEDGAQLIDVACYTTAADGHGSAPALGQAIALRPEVWRALLPEIAALIGEGEAA